MFDTVTGGDYLTDQDAAEILAKDAPRAIYELEHMGVPFNRTAEGKIAQRAFGGHTKNFGEASIRRACHAADRSGRVMLDILYWEVVKRGIKVYSEFQMLDLIMKDDRVAGIVAYELSTGEVHIFHSRVVMIATGGFGKVYKTTSNCFANTGDGAYHAYRAGIPLEDMEFVQFHPTTLKDTGILITEGARGEGAHLLNANGERFMEKYAPNKMELASRDVVSRAEQTEINEGRGFPDGTVALDITVVPRKRIHEALREIVLVGRDFAGVDITREPIHIKPGNHYTMGGVKTDVDGATEIPGLYAAGECACVSVHGGNRLGANSLLDTLIFGRRAGAHAANRAKGTGFAHVSKAVLDDEERQIAAILGRERGSGRRISEIRRELGETMDRYVAVFRDEEGITKALETVRRLKEEAESAYIDDKGAVFNQDVLGAIELGFMLDNAETIVVSALERKESRGAQYRTDFPDRNDDDWLKHITVSADGDEPEVAYSEVTLTQWEPEERKY